MIYLACPYSSPDPKVRTDRVELASMAAANLMAKGIPVFSPITHGHLIAQHLPPEKLLDHNFWMRQCLPFVLRAETVLILPLKGWQQSKGVDREVTIALLHNIPCHLYVPPELSEMCSLELPSHLEIDSTPRIYN